MSTPRPELALANLKALLDAVSDCTALADFDLAIDWEQATTNRFVIQRTNTFRQRTRVYQTIWTLLPVLELHVCSDGADGHATLRTKVMALFADVVAAISVDPTLGGIAERCELVDDGEPSEMIVNDVPERGAAAVLQVPLAIIVATAPNDLTIKSVAA